MFLLDSNNASNKTAILTGHKVAHADLPPNHALTAEKFTKEVEERVPVGQLIPAQPQLQPQPEPEPEVMLAPEPAPEPLPQPQPEMPPLKTRKMEKEERRREHEELRRICSDDISLKIEIVEPEPEMPLRKTRQMEKEERRRKHEAMMEELRRICSDDIYEFRKLKIREVEGKGYCVFATVPISSGSPVCEYKGTYVSRKVAKSVAQCYVFDFTHNNRAMSIDATKHLGTVGRFISHSRDSPNLVCQKVEFTDDSRPHLVFFAIRDIRVGEEIAYEYGDFSQGSADRFPWMGKPYLQVVSKVWRNEPF